ncbi:MAG TPA: prepilin-type N-terminal cleavage/methylation domain-containing protein [Thermodesulfobacteriota bacterium]
MRAHEKGFTLLELIITMGILGVVTAAIFSVYNTQRTVTYVEADVADVQQNLRLSVQSVLKDLRMAGFMLAGGLPPIASAADGSGPGSSDALTINTAAAGGAACRIDAELSIALSTAAPFTLAVTSASDLEWFADGDAVRILSPGESAEVADMAYTVVSRDPSAPSITVRPAMDGDIVDFKRGFIIARTGESLPDAFPNTVEYCLGPSALCAPAVVCPAGLCLMRIVNGSPSEDSIAATNIGGLQFRYILDNGPAELDSPADLSAVRDVKVLISGMTVQTAPLTGAPKTRELTAISRIRNR